MDGRLFICFKLFFLLNCALFSVGIQSGYKFRLDYEWRQELNGWLKYHQIPSSWMDARLRCELEGAQLAYPQDMSSLYNEMNTLIKDIEIGRPILIGIHDLLSMGDLITIDGTLLSQLDIPMPYGHRNESQRCIALAKDQKLIFIDCKHEAYSYFCFKDYTNLQDNPICQTIDSGYVYENRTGSCYKFHSHGRTWHVAHEACISEGAKLAVINSETEAQVLTEILRKHPEDSLPRHVQHKYVTCLGFHSLFEQNDWQTIEGKKLEESGYSKWGKNQPDQHVPGVFCGAMFRDGTLDDYYCNTKCTFICEKKSSLFIKVSQH